MECSPYSTLPFTVAIGTFHHIQQSKAVQGDISNFLVVIGFRAVVGRAEMHLECAGGVQLRTFVRPGKGSVQQLKSVARAMMRSISEAICWNSPIIRCWVASRAGDGLLGQLLHTDEFFVDDA